MPSENDVPGSEDEKLKNTFLKKTFASIFVNIQQSGTEIGEVIKRCINEENPPVRIQTSDATIQMAKEVLVDVTGNNITKQLEARLK